MRREVRKKINNNDDLNVKIIKYSAIGVAVLTIIVFAILIYSRNLNKEVKEGILSSEQISSILNSGEQIDTESVSTEIGKSINEVSNELNNEINTQNSTNSKNEVLSTNKMTPTATILNNNVNKKESDNNSISGNENNEESNSQNIELKFEKPVEGEIIREYAVESLIYSETLQEWTTHTGIDIAAEKTTVVKSVEAGTIKTIKNDPRYGLTVIIEHQNGYQSIYSNLLTAEFIVEGEKVEKGQSLGTVGNTAAFEIADEPHLHFEMLKDSIQVDPTIYLN